MVLVVFVIVLVVTVDIVPILGPRNLTLKFSQNRVSYSLSLFVVCCCWLLLLLLFLTLSRGEGF